MRQHDITAVGQIQARVNEVGLTAGLSCIRGRVVSCPVASPLFPVRTRFEARYGTNVWLDQGELSSCSLSAPKNLTLRVVG